MEETVMVVDGIAQTDRRPQSGRVRPEPEPGRRSWGRPSACWPLPPSAGASAQDATAQRALAGQSVDNGAVILMYHRFGEDSLPSTSVRLSQFDAHLDELISGGYQVLPLGEIVAALEEGRRLPDRSLAIITVDDGALSVTPRPGCASGRAICPSPSSFPASRWIFACPAISPGISCAR